MAAAQYSLDDFPRLSLRRLQADLAFDGAWWGLNSDRQIRSSTCLGLPAGRAADWSSTKDWDPIAEQAISRPGQTVVFNADQLEAFPRKKAWLAKYGIAHVLCTTYALEPLGITTFLSLYRSSGAFSEQERKLKQLLMPHLTMAMQGNWHRCLHELAAQDAQPGTCLALADHQGLLHCADARFVTLVRAEWPDWQGPHLPAAVARALGDGADSPVCDVGTLRAELSEVRDLVLLRLTRRSPLLRLSMREHDVALAYAQGHSYKRVARESGLAAATVRHYLRKVYAKLGVSNKAELARIVSGQATRLSGSEALVRATGSATTSRSPR